MTKLAKIEEPATDLLPADPMVSMIERVAMDPDADLEKLESMMALKERHEANEAKAAFASAFSKASADFPTIPLNGSGHNGKAYATLKDITRLTRPVLSENGLALSFSIDVGQEVVVTAELMHKGGHSKTTSIALPRDSSGSKNAVQSVGSSQTYGQRYTAQAILGLSLGDDVEDDGRSTGAPIEEPKRFPSWAETVVQDMPPDATPRAKAEAVADALKAQWKRKNSRKQLDNEWDRRTEVLDKMETNHPDLWAEVCEAYDLRVAELES